MERSRRRHWPPSQTAFEHIPVFPSEYGQISSATCRSALQIGQTRKANDGDTDKANDPWREVLIECPIHVDRPLHSRVFALTGLSELDTDLITLDFGKDLAARLNQNIRKGESIYQHYSKHVTGLGPGREIAVKIARGQDPDGITNLEFVHAQVLGLPTPLTLGFITSPSSYSYFFMTHAEGVTLESVWPMLTPSIKSSVQEQLIAMFKLLRGEKQVASDYKIGNFVSGKCKDARRNTRISSTPICNESDFNAFLCHDEIKTVTPWVKMVQSSLTTNHRIVMTHGDLHPRKIIVQLERQSKGKDNGYQERDDDKGENESEDVYGIPSIRVVSLIDWEYGG